MTAAALSIFPAQPPAHIPLPQTPLKTDIFTVPSLQTLAEQLLPIPPCSPSTHPQPGVSITEGNQTVCEGASVNLTASATSSIAITGYQWYQDSSPIGGATRSTYSFGTVASGDAGSYTVDVTNACGTATSSAAILTVNTEPTVDTHPLNQIKCDGETATFTAAVSGSPVPSVQWQVNPGTGFTNIVGETNLTLNVIANLSESGYLYRAVFTNTCGTIPSNSASLTVNPLPATPTGLSASPAIYLSGQQQLRPFSNRRCRRSGELV